MRLENTSRITDSELRKLFNRVIRSAPLGRARTWLEGKDGLYVCIQTGKRSRCRGKIYPSATVIYRKGKPINVRSYIKLYIFSHTTLADVAKTFAHELSHFKDWYDYAFMGDYSNIPYGREKRARAFADRVVKRLKPNK